MATTASNRILAALGSRLLASTPTAISRLEWRLLAVATAVGISTWRAGTTAIMGISTWKAGTTALWIASVGDNTTSNYNFHATHGKTPFRIFTRLLHIPDKSISHS
jgi:hypothetical protein